MSNIHLSPVGRILFCGYAAFGNDVSPFSLFLSHPLSVSGRVIALPIRPIGPSDLKVGDVSPCLAPGFKLRETDERCLP